jgi:hypothetical protein
VAAVGRFARSWDLTKTSWRVLMQDKELLWMPVLSFLASLMAVAAISGVGFVSGVWPEVTAEDGSVRPASALLAFAMYIALAFVALFFNAATVAGASERLAGGDPTVGSAKLFLWSIVVATVNVILQAIRERSGFLGQILTSIAGTAWNLATYFMVPILLFEDKGVGASLKRSGGLFKRTWGETVVGDYGIGLAGFAATILVVVVGVLLIMLLSALGTFGTLLGIALLVLGVIIVAAVFSTLAGVYKAAIYRYAASGQEAGGFTHQQLGGAFHPKGQTPNYW